MLGPKDISGCNLKVILLTGSAEVRAQCGKSEDDNC